MLISILAFFILLYWLIILISGTKGFLSIKNLPNSKNLTDTSLPYVSIIVAAKEEEHTITQTVVQLMAQNYPRYEIIAINDRSQDKTGLKLNELKQLAENRSHHKVPYTIIHITNLPKKWLGKNHALYQGYLQAKGNILLFTDADVRFHPDTLRDAAQYMKQNNVDHLSLFPNMLTAHWSLRAFVHFFLFSLFLYTQPWRANDDRHNKHGMGIGAFNMLTKHAYESIGTHKAFALRPDDDLQLGNRVKQAGFRQRLLSAKSYLEVEWYSNLYSALKGLEKNMFSGFQYNIYFSLAAVGGQFLFFLFPYIASFWASGFTLLAFIASIVIMSFLYLLTIQRFSNEPGIEVIILPFSIVLLIYTILRSVWLVLRRGGIYWRGTFYSIKDLKAENNKK